jgi:peptidyl-prolyl cis-trans isomerase B (cyclophilin B)
MALFAEIQTNKGSMTFELFEDKAPITVKNFIALSIKGFYDGLIFFKYIRGVLIQTGCPKNDGTSDAGYFIDYEKGGQLDNGTLAMAKTRQNLVSSQFFIVLDRTEARQFEGNHSAFGVLSKGMETMLALREGDQILKISFFRVEN